MNQHKAVSPTCSSGNCESPTGNILHSVILNLIIQTSFYQHSYSIWIMLGLSISIAPHLVIALPTLRQQKLLLLTFYLIFCISFLDWIMTSFLYCFPYSYRSCDSNSCRSFTFLKAIAKSKSKHIAIAFKSERGQ